MTWDDYIKESGNWGADRDDFDDAIDFMGWFIYKTNKDYVGMFPILQKQAAPVTATGQPGATTEPGVSPEVESLSVDSIEFDAGGLGAAGGVVGIVILVVQIVVVLLLVASLWGIFAKAGKPGWGSIIPIWNTILILQVAGKPAWWFILLLVPVVGFVIWIIACIGLAKSFGKGAGFGIGLLLLPIIFLPILAFGSAQHASVTAAAMAAELAAEPESE